ncbi:circadian clock KaiB family protein, partial [Microcoleus sp. HI-ES]|nr:circadian clock KaiB family protein [Microcoleus sp. HI-ES]
MRLFVSGSNPSTERTLETLHQFLEKCLDRPYTLKVIDVLKHPDQAEADQISATPTLIKFWPKPVRRIVGELNDDENI